jgi:hypothetical protein
MPVVGPSSLAELAAAFELESAYEPVGSCVGLALEHYHFGT